MNDDASGLGRRYQNALGRRSPGPDRPDLEEIAALAAGRLDEARALPLLDRVMADPELKAEFELLRATHLAAGRAEPRWRAPRWLAAAAVVTLTISAGLAWRALREGTPVVRGGVAAALVTPADGASAGIPVTLIWRPVEGALRYRVSIADSAGREVLTTTTTDTSLVVPAPILEPGTVYRWWIEAGTTTGGSIRSDVHRFRPAASGAG